MSQIWMISSESIEDCSHWWVVMICEFDVDPPHKFHSRQVDEEYNDKHSRHTPIERLHWSRLTNHLNFKSKNLYFLGMSRFLRNQSLQSLQSLNCSEYLTTKWWNQIKGLTFSMCASHWSHRYSNHGFCWIENAFSLDSGLAVGWLSSSTDLNVRALSNADFLDGTATTSLIHSFKNSILLVVCISMSVLHTHFTHNQLFFNQIFIFTLIMPW